MQLFSPRSFSWILSNCLQYRGVTAENADNLRKVLELFHARAFPGEVSQLRDLAEGAIQVGRPDLLEPFMEYITTNFPTVTHLLRLAEQISPRNEQIVEMLEAKIPALFKFGEMEGRL